MTRINAAIPLPPKPSTVSLCELAIAAGTTGRSVAVHFQDFPAHIICQLWRYSVDFAGQGEVSHVRTQGDIRKLPKACGSTKLVLVHSEKLLTATSWAIELCSLADTEANSRPAIFCVSSPGSGENEPGVALALRANPAEVSAVGRWFSLGQIPTVPSWQAIGQDMAVTPVPALTPVLSPMPESESDVRHLRAQVLLRCLVVGAAVLRSIGPGAEQSTAIEELTLTTDDYEQVRRLLQSPSAAPADEACDPLAKDMVNRANVFLRVKYAEPYAQDNPFNIDGADSPPGNGANRELVTRREIADLGNVHSRLVRQLVEFVRRRNDGHERFQRMGLVRRPPPPDRWQNVDTATLVNCLRAWTAKQVRTHFDRLRRHGMISAERETANGPWRYALPEEIQGRRGHYRCLPTVAELMARGPHE
jgi:hypothetical protein